MGFKHHWRIRSPVDHFEWNARERSFQTSTPGCTCLACVGADIEVNKPRTRWTLNEWTKEIGRRTFRAGFCPDTELKAQIIGSRSLLLDRLVVVAAPLLQTEVYAGWWLLQDNAKRQFALHESPCALMSIFQAL